jgi:hypothetical protein
MLLLIVLQLYLDPTALEEVDEIPEDETCTKDVGNAQQLRGHSRGTSGCKRMLIEVIFFY